MISTADWNSLVGAISDEDIRDGIEDRVARDYPWRRGGRMSAPACRPPAPSTERRRDSVSGRSNATAKILWHPTISPDGSVADSDDAMERVSEYPEPNARIEEVMQTTGPVPEGSPDGSSECRRLNVGLTARHRRATVPDIGPGE